MIAPPSDVDVTTSDLLFWARDQARFLSPMEALVLYYLVSCAHVTKDNAEQAPRGQVMYGSSSYADIMAGTGIKSENTVRAALNGLQDKAYVFRKRRKGEGQRPLVIGVLYDEDCEEMRERIRSGEEPDPRLMIRPTARKQKPKLALVTTLDTRSI